MKFRLQHESGETILPLDNADEYPTPRHLEASRTEWTLESGMLKRVMKRSQFACANDDLRPVMNGMYFDLLSPLWQGGGYKAGVEMRLAA